MAPPKDLIRSAVRGIVSTVRPGKPDSLSSHPDLKKHGGVAEDDVVSIDQIPTNVDFSLYDTKPIQWPVINWKTGKLRERVELDPYVFDVRSRGDILAEAVRWTRKRWKKPGKLEFGKRNNRFTRAYVYGKRGRGRPSLMHRFMGHRRSGRYNTETKVKPKGPRLHGYDWGDVDLSIRMAISLKRHQGRLVVVDSAELATSSPQELHEICVERGWWLREAPYRSLAPLHPDETEDHRIANWNFMKLKRQIDREAELEERRKRIRAEMYRTEDANLPEGLADGDDLKSPEEDCEDALEWMREQGLEPQVMGGEAGDHIAYARQPRSQEVEATMRQEDRITLSGKNPTMPIPPSQIAGTTGILVVDAADNDAGVDPKLWNAGRPIEYVTTLPAWSDDITMMALRRSYLILTTDAVDWLHERYYLDKWESAPLQWRLQNPGPDLEDHLGVRL